VLSIIGTSYKNSWVMDKCSSTAQMKTNNHVTSVISMSLINCKQKCSTKVLILCLVFLVMLIFAKSCLFSGHLTSTAFYMHVFINSSSKYGFDAIAVSLATRYLAFTAARLTSQLWGKKAECCFFAPKHNSFLLLICSCKPLYFSVWWVSQWTKMSYSSFTETCWKQRFPIHLRNSKLCLIPSFLTKTI